jgi:hypothetical protein
MRLLENFHPFSISAFSSSSAIAQTGAVNADPDFTNYNADPAGPCKPLR